MAKKRKPKTMLSQAANLLPDVEQLEHSVSAVLNEELYWFPVRHHSPTVAHHLQAAILSRKPKVVFIEGPWEANHLTPHIVDRKTRPPVAIYSSYRDDDNTLGLAGIASPAADIPARFACWYPLVEYSPEYVAMQAAKKIGAEVVFIDLPHYAQISGGDENETPPNDANADEDISNHEPMPAAEGLIASSDFYQQLADAAGYSTWDEGWDALFEFGRTDDDIETYRREMAVFCAAARATCAQEQIASDGTLPRERHMWRAIQNRLDQGDVAAAEAMVVCGGFHLFLDRADSTPPPEPPAGTVYTTVVPYSYFHISQLSGYAAGNRAPQFYSMYSRAVQGKLDDLTAEYVVSVLMQARKRGETLSSADAISATQHARMLAALRGRAVPILEDLHDAIVTCCCKGDPHEDGVHLLRAIDDVDIGSKVGTVTPKLGRLPIVHDFYKHLEDHELGEVMGRAKRLRIELDKREEADVQKSAFLHRLVYLGVPMCGLTEAPAEDFATGMIFRERWALKWSPDVEPKLVEQNLYGDSLESAVVARLRENIARDEPHAGRTCQRLVRAIDMNLPDLIREVEETCGDVIDEDSRFASLSEALGHLTVIDRYAIYQELKRDTLNDLIVRCFNRACFAIIDTIAAPEEQQQEVISGLLRLAEIVLKGGNDQIDRTLFAEHVASAAEETAIPYLRGAYLGLLAELRVVSASELAEEISALSKSTQDKMIAAGELLHGIMTVSRTSILLGAKSLVGAMNELLVAAEWEPFLLMLPRMRAAFEQLHARQRDSVAAVVAEQYGLKETAAVTELRTSAAAAARIAEIDRKVAAIMQDWSF